jgi:hypothetical protein
MFINMSESLISVIPPILWEMTDKFEKELKIITEKSTIMVSRNSYWTGLRGKELNQELRKI